jgi:MOSC domain-containing protein YiiM
MTHATITSIVVKPRSEDTDTASLEADGHGFLRLAVTEANLIAGYGIEGDRKGGNPKRQLNIMSAETLAVLQSEGYDTTPGAMGEQIVISGLAVETLEAGAVLKIGDEAQIEVLIKRNGCDKFAAHQGFPKENTVGRLGVMAGVLTSGLIRVGDPVRVDQSQTTITD